MASTARTLDLIDTWYQRHDGMVYVSYSGGKDSTVLGDLVHTRHPDVPLVYVDHGEDLSGVREMALSKADVILHPDMTMRDIVQVHGYPVISKQVSKAISQYQRGCPCGLRRVGCGGRYDIAKYRDLLDGPYKISAKCCDILKLRPIRTYERLTGRSGCTGMRAEEGSGRAINVSPMSDDRCNPLLDWTSKDVMAYIRDHELEIPWEYRCGYNRTGCVSCACGIMFDRHRFQRLKLTHPAQWDYVMRDIDDGGLGMRGLLDLMGIPTGCETTTLDQYNFADMLNDGEAD